MWLLLPAAHASPMTWTVEGRVDSLSAEDLHAEVERAAEVWTVKDPSCGEVALFEQAQDPAAAQVVFRVVDDPELLFTRITDCSPGSFCVVEISQRAAWASLEDAHTEGCMETVSPRWSLAHSFGHAFGLETYGPGTYVDSSMAAAVMFFQFPECPSFVALTEGDLELLEPWQQVPLWEGGHEDGGSLSLPKGQPTELGVWAPRLQQVDWRLDGEPAGQGDTFSVSPVSPRTLLQADVRYEHGLCGEINQGLSLWVYEDRDTPGTVLPPTRSGEPGCSLAPGPAHPGGMAALWGVWLLVGLRRRS